MPTAILAREGNVRIMLTPWKAERRGRNKVSGDITGLLDPASSEAVNFLYFFNEPFYFLSQCFLLQLKYSFLILLVSAP